MRRPWTQRDIVIVVGAQLAGFAVAYVGFWMAFFGLPPDGLWGDNNPTSARVLGVLGAVLCAVGLSAGCWVVWRCRRHPAALVAAVVVMIAVAIVSAAWALQLDLG